MNDRILVQVQKLGSRVEWILRKLQAIADWQRWAEQRIRELNFPPSQFNLSAGGGSNYFDTAVVGKTTTSVGPRSGSSYGTGTVKLQTDGGSSLSDYSPTTTFTAKNLLNKTVASGAYVLCVKVGTSWWVIAAGDCSNIS